MGLPHHQVRGREVGTVHSVREAAPPYCSSSPSGQVQDLPGSMQVLPAMAPTVMEVNNSRS